MYSASEINIAAQIAHEANRVWSIHNGETGQKHWEDASEWQRESSLTQIQAVLNGATPRQLHESWCEEKRLKGWVYGEKKDEVLKTHPCLVPYENLPYWQRQKDDLFITIVESVLGSIVE